MLLEFLFGDILPTYSDVAVGLFIITQDQNPQQYKKYYLHFI